MTNRPGPELQALIGEEALVRLAEAFAGTRLYVPVKITRDHAIARAIGFEAACRLSERLAPDVIKVPLARELRARHHRAADRSNAWIATRLGITETGVEMIFNRARAAKKPEGPDLFGRPTA